MFLIQEESILGKGLIAFVGDVYQIGMHIACRMVSNLSSFTMLLQSFDGSLEDVAVTQPCPTTLQRTLPHLRHIHKTVVIVIVRLVEYLIMSQQGCAPSFRKFEVASEVRLQFSFRIIIDVRVREGRSLWFLEFNVDLACDALVAVLHRRSTLRHLYALHPRASDIT